MHGPLVNFSFYRFLPLENLPALRHAVRELGEGLRLQGTVLLAAEGVNGMVSGPPEAIASFRQACRGWFGAMEAKEAPVAEHSFHRFLVKLKKEIISVGDSTLVPAARTGKRLAPEILKAWLDEGRPLYFLDTRNGYEVEVGTFRGARHLGLEASRDFTAKAKALLPEMEGQTVVTFCTGGIRCEKASAWLVAQGISDVYQLDGGILGYFEKNGGVHFEGNCFVYDWRLAVDGALQPAPRSENPVQSFGRHRLPDNE